MNDPGGLRRILLCAPDGSRKTIRLAKVNKRDAESFKLRVEALLACKLLGRPLDGELAAWLAERDDKTAAKLAKAGLIEPRTPQETATLALAAFVDDYIARRTDVKPRSKANYQQARKYLVEFFGADRSLDSITKADADDWRRWMLGNKGLAENTARKWSAMAKCFARYALDKELIRKNPFAGLPSKKQEETDRQAFVDHAIIAAVIDACPDAEWPAIFALARFGGLRCPSEVLALRLCDVDWEHDRIIVRSSKTEHHAGKDTRTIPLFAELRPWLLAAVEGASDGAEFIINRYRSADANLRTQTERIIRRAGLKPWPKTFQNLRSSRETDLAETYPIHVVCKWIGNSEAVARKHYLQLTDEHFDRAVGTVREGAEKSGARTAQRDPADNRRESHSGGATPSRCATFAVTRETQTVTSKGLTTPTGSRTPVFGLRIRRPRPLDDRGENAQIRLSAACG